MTRAIGSTRRVALALTIASAMGLVAATPAAAEIDKVARQTDDGLSFSWIPKTPPPKGWIRDEGASTGYAMNAMAVAGGTFADASSVIYGRALYKKREKVSTIDELIAADAADFRGADPAMVIAPLAPVRDTAGRTFRVSAFQPSSKGNWEAVAYGEETDAEGNAYWVIFVLSSRTRADFDASLPAFREMLQAYR